VSVEPVIQSKADEECGFVYNTLYLYRKGIVFSSPLAKAFYVLSVVKRGTADNIAKYTGRHRVIESRLLSKLNKIGIVAKVREGRKIYYMDPVEAVKEALEKNKDLSLEMIAHNLHMRLDIVEDIARCLENEKR